ncbi:hypothetical protein WJX72_009391 [[Myrmecia] bisecta]|uniref:cyclic pyranopterin monophosphate synthase n=1 Tax=[Myrmecia] bisecta TaxID=41462 RepID=A0AAW1PM70_9CHLO
MPVWASVQGRSYNTGTVLGRPDKEIAALNQELDEFFGASNAAPAHDLPSNLERDQGKAAMVDVGHKADTRRVARASARVLLGPDLYQLVASNRMKKGDVLTVAQLAGVMGAKHTSLLIPLCHNIFISSVKVDLQLDPQRSAVNVNAEAQTVGPTGVEMEALTAAAVAALTVYDMCKAVSKDITITDLRLDHKSGGKSGDFTRPAGT